MKEETYLEIIRMVSMFIAGAGFMLGIINLF